MLAYFITFSIVKDIRTIRSCLNIFIISASLLSLLAIFEHYLGLDRIMEIAKNSRLTTIIMEPDTIKEKLANNSMNWINWAGEYSSLRAFGTFEDVISFSAYLGLAIPFFPSILYSKSRRDLFFYLILCGITILALILSFSRSGFLSFFVILFLFLCLLTKESNRLSSYINKKLAVIISLFIVISGSIILCNSSIRHPIIWRFSKPLDNQFDRTNHWLNGTKVFLQKPIYGVGLANYRSGLLRFSDKDAPLVPAHNQYIQIAAEMGLLGFISYVAILYLGIKYSWEIYTKSKDIGTKLTGLGFGGLWIWYYIQSLFSTYLFAEKFSMMFWLMVGLNASLYKIYLKEQADFGHDSLHEQTLLK